MKDIGKTRERGEGIEVTGDIWTCMLRIDLKGGDNNGVETGIQKRHFPKEHR